MKKLILQLINLLDYLLKIRLKMKFLYQLKEESLLLKIFMKELLDLILKICATRILVQKII